MPKYVLYVWDMRVLSVIMIWAICCARKANGHSGGARTMQYLYICSTKDYARALLLILSLRRKAFAIFAQYIRFLQSYYYIYENTLTYFPILYFRKSFWHYVHNTQTVEQNTTEPHHSYESQRIINNFLMFTNVLLWPTDKHKQKYSPLTHTHTHIHTHTYIFISTMYIENIQKSKSFHIVFVEQ